MITIQTSLQISDSGRVARLFHSNGRLIAEFLIHGPFLEAARNCDSNLPIIRGRPNVYRAEVFGLAGYEYLDISQERIEERRVLSSKENNSNDEEVKTI